MAGEIFISYRWSDADWFAHALYQALDNCYSAGTVFMDVRSTRPGKLIPATVREQVERCRVLLAVVGERWLTAADASGRRRLDDPHDLVRFEIGTALEQGKTVIPVLINDVRVPREEELPDALKRLAQCKAIRLPHEDFPSSTRSLLLTLTEYHLPTLKGTGTRLQEANPRVFPSASETNFVRALAKAYIDITSATANAPTEESLARRRGVKEAYLALQRETKSLAGSRPIQLALPCPSINPLTLLCRNLMQEGRNYAGLQWPSGHQYTVTSHDQIFPESERLIAEIPERFVINRGPFGRVIVHERALVVAVLDAFLSHLPNISDRSAGDAVNAAAKIINELTVRTAIAAMVEYKVGTWCTDGPPHKLMAVNFPIPAAHPVTLVIKRLLHAHLADITFSWGSSDVALEMLDGLRRHGIPHVNFLEDIIEKFGPLLRGGET